jgi:hypothetical protein
LNRAAEFGAYVGALIMLLIETYGRDTGFAVQNSTVWKKGISGP